MPPPYVSHDLPTQEKHVNHYLTDVNHYLTDVNHYLTDVNHYLTDEPLSH
jgi:hypothetical protein